jgi:hypothetical protein
MLSQSCSTNTCVVAVDTSCLRSSCTATTGDWLESHIDFLSLQAQLFGNTLYSYRQQIAVLLRNQRRIVDE